MFLLNTIIVHSAQVIRRPYGRGLRSDQISLGTQKIDCSKLSAYRRELLEIFSQHGISCKKLHVGESGNVKGLEVELKKGETKDQQIKAVSDTLRGIGFKVSTVSFEGDTAIFTFNNQIVLV